MSKFDFGKLSDEELGKVVGGMSYNFGENSTITVVLEPDESAVEALGAMSLPLGLRLDSESSDLLINTVAPAMGTTGPRQLIAQYKIKYPYVHIESYTVC